MALSRLVYLALIVSVHCLRAGVVQVDTGLWYEFGFTSAGVSATGCAPADPGGVPCAPSSAGNSIFADTPVWTFVAPNPGVVLLVTDAFLAGDIFSIADFGSVIGSTFNVAASDHFCGSDPEDCILDPEMGSGFFVLLPGNHSLSITPTATPFASPERTDAAYFFLRTADASEIPEPNLGALVAGFLALCSAWRFSTGLPRRRPPESPWRNWGT